MSEKEFQTSDDSHRNFAADPEQTGPVCDDINDPVRRSLCRVCGLPVVSAAPFCKDHEPPVP